LSRQISTANALVLSGLPNFRLWQYEYYPETGFEETDYIHSKNIDQEKGRTPPHWAMALVDARANLNGRALTIRHDDLTRLIILCWL
jgi:hypothetical protein